MISIYLLRIMMLLAMLMMQSHMLQQTTANVTETFQKILTSCDLISGK